MMKKTAVVLSIALVTHLFAFIPASAQSSSVSVTAQSALLAEKSSGAILFEKDIYRRHPADSLSRIVTIMLAAQEVENDIINDNELIEMTESAWHDIDEGSTTQGIQPGQAMTFIDLMYSAFTGSANEACNMIALRMRGSTEAFVQAMNDKAAELGCTDTHFVNPHGQYHENQYTTAQDMYIIYSEALKSSLFAEIAGTFRHETEWSEDLDSRTLTSTNSMLNQGSIYYYRNCQSGLTSNTFEGGFSMVSSAVEDGLELVSVVLGAREVINADQSVTLRHFTETQQLFTWGYDNYSWREIIKTTDLLARVPVSNGAGADFVNVRPERALLLLLDNSVSTDSYDMNIVIFSERNNTPLVAPVSEGDKLGEVTISRNGVIYDTIPLIANTDIELSRMEYMRRELGVVLRSTWVRNVIIVLVIIVLIYAALVIRYNVMRLNRLKRIKNAKNDALRDRHENFRD